MTKHKKTSDFKRYLKCLGPGLIAGAADDDPSGIVTYSIAGARHGMALLWLSWLTWPLMGAVQMMCARIGMVTGRGLGSVLKEKFPKSVVLFFCGALFIANTINVGADLAGMADAAALLSGVNTSVFVVVFGVAISIALVKFNYERISGVLKWLVISLFAYVVTAFMVHPNWGAVAHSTFLPTLPKGNAMWQTIVAILGTTISPYLFFWQSAEEVEERLSKGLVAIPRRFNEKSHEVTERMVDVGAGTLLSNVVMFFIILTAALTLHVQGKTDITSSREAAEALKPLAGEFASALYALAIVAVGLLSIPTLAGSAGFAFSETLNWSDGLSKKFGEATPFYAVILASIGVAMAMNFMGINPMDALFWSAVVNGVVAPFLLLGILIVARDKKVMRKHPSSLLSQIVVGITTLAMFAAALVMGYGMMMGGK